MIVAATNLVSYLVIEVAHTEQARAAYERDPLWVLPPLWRSEFLSVLAVSVRANVLTERLAQSAWWTALSVVGDAEQEPDPLAVLRLAVKNAISAYDAQFVVLARALDTVLVTSDRKLARQCPENVTLVDEFVGG